MTATDSLTHALPGAATGAPPSSARDMAHDVPVILWMLDRRGNCIYLDEQWTRYTGQKSSEALANWGTCIHPDDLDHTKRVCRLGRETKRTISTEFRLRRYDGEYRWFHDTGVPRFNSRDEYIGVVGIMIEVSERKANELSTRITDARLRLALDAARLESWECILPTSLTKEPARATPERVHEHPDICVSHHAYLHEVHTDDRDKVAQALSDTIRLEQDYRVEFRVTDPEGSTRWFESQARLLTDGDGKQRQLIGVTEEVTDRRAASEEHTRLQVQFQQAQKMQAIGHLTGGIAHDFNNILGSILGYSRLALQRFDGHIPEKLREYLSQIYTAGERARELTDQMIAFSRGGETSREVYDVRLLVQDVIKMLRPTFPATISLDCRPPKHVMNVKTNIVEFHQIIVNLCGNARDALGEEGEIRVDVSRSSQAAFVCSSCHENVAGDFITIAVTDNGPGIPAEVIQRMFEPFFSTKRQSHGGGMGLPIVHGIVHRHGGHLVVQTALDKGATFAIHLRTTDAAGSCASARSNAETGPARRQHHILVVDDELAISNFLSELLELEGYLVTRADDAQGAWEIFSDNSATFDAVITDQTMPGLTGTELATRIKAQRPQTRILLMTGYCANLEPTEETPRSYDILLKKPLDADHFLRVLADLLAPQD